MQTFKRFKELLQAAKISIKVLQRQNRQIQSNTKTCLRRIGPSPGSRFSSTFSRRHGRPNCTWAMTIYGDDDGGGDGNDGQSLMVMVMMVMKMMTVMVVMVR